MLRRRSSRAALVAVVVLALLAPGCAKQAPSWNTDHRHPVHDTGLDFVRIHPVTYEIWEWIEDKDGNKKKVKRDTITRLCPGTYSHSLPPTKVGGGDNHYANDPDWVLERAQGSLTCAASASEVGGGDHSLSTVSFELETVFFVLRLAEGTWDIHGQASLPCRREDSCKGTCGELGIGSRGEVALALRSPVLVGDACLRPGKDGPSGIVGAFPGQERPDACPPSESGDNAYVVLETDGERLVARCSGSMAHAGIPWVDIRLEPTTGFTPAHPAWIVVSEEGWHDVETSTTGTLERFSREGRR